jgi:hypothetical protein
MAAALSAAVRTWNGMANRVCLVVTEAIAFCCWRSVGEAAKIGVLKVLNNKQLSINSSASRSVFLSIENDVVTDRKSMKTRNLE